MGEGSGRGGSWWGKTDEICERVYDSEPEIFLNHRVIFI